MKLGLSCNGSSAAEDTPQKAKLNNKLSDCSRQLPGKTMTLRSHMSFRRRKRAPLRVHHGPYLGVAQLGSVCDLGSQGRGFKSHHPDICLHRLTG